MNRKRLKYVLQFAIILIFDSLIKGFDQSYNGVFHFSFRGIFFFVSFLLFWMTAWAIISGSLNGIENRLHGKIKPVSIFAILSSVSLISSAGAAILFNLFYRFYDVHLFRMNANWEHVPFPHPELIYPLMLMTLLICIFDLYVKYSTRLENVKLYATTLEQDNIQAQYQALKNQVDPHFFFNSLSVLNSIVHTDPEQASNYIHNLSKLYRYTLETKQNNVVRLSDELSFLDSYLYLMKIRYPYSLIFKIGLDRSKTDHWGIHPNSLQLLIENAIKHNTFRDEDPLEIEIAEDDDYILVKNKLRKKKQPAPSTGIGLDNIRRRYELCDKKKIVVQEINGYFIVKLPKIEIA